LNSDAAFSSWELAPGFFENFISDLIRVELWLIMTLSMYNLLIIFSNDQISSNSILTKCYFIICLNLIIQVTKLNVIIMVVVIRIFSSWTHTINEITVQFLVLVQRIDPLIITPAHITPKHSPFGMILPQMAYHIIFCAKCAFTFMTRERL